MTEAQKCVVRDGKFVEPCSFLRTACEGDVPRGRVRGLFKWAYTSGLTGQPTRTFYGVKSGKHTSSGLVFAFCPWCGERIDAPVAGDDAQKI